MILSVMLRTTDKILFILLGPRGPVPRRAYFAAVLLPIMPVIGSYPVMKMSGRGGCPNAAISRASTLTEAPGRHRRLDEAP